MKLEIWELKPKDYIKAMEFSISGMHFNWYIKNEFLLHLYVRYFFYSELARSSHVIAAYVGNNLVGVLLAEIYDKPKFTLRWWEKFYIRMFDVLQHLFAAKGINAYNLANKKMFETYKNHYIPDGEIVFLASDINRKIKGVGTILLNELEIREPGKEVFLYTDNGCTYQFYENRDFVLTASQNIKIKVGRNITKLTTMLFRKKL